MKEYDATEQAYKNGYRQAVEDIEKSAKSVAMSMTEAELMKALECCKTTNGEDCKNCPLFLVETKCDCVCVVLADVLDLINRKNAEIERAEKSRAEWKEAALRKAKELDKSQNELSNLKFDLMCGTTKAQAEVIQLFVGRVKAHSRKMQSSDWGGEFWDRAVLVTDIDQIAKEMGVEL